MVKTSEKRKVGRPKLADGNLKKKAFIYIMISLILVVILAFFGLRTLFVHNEKISVLKGSATNVLHSNQIDTYSVVKSGKDAKLCDIRLLSLNGNTIKYQVRCQANARPSQVRLTSGDKTTKILTGFNYHKGYIKTETYKFNGNLSKDAYLSVRYKKNDENEKTDKNYYITRYYIYKGNLLNTASEVKISNSNALPSDKCDLSVFDISNKSFKMKVNCDSEAKPTSIRLERTYNDKEGSQLFSLKNNNIGTYGASFEKEIKYSKLTPKTNYKLVLYFGTRNYDYYKTSVNFNTADQTSEEKTTNKVTTINSSKTTTTKNQTTTVSKTTVNTTKATTKAKETTKTTPRTTTIKSDITCPTITYSKDGKNFSSTPDDVYNSNKVYLKISMDNSKYAYNKWYWYSDNGKGGFTKWSNDFEKNNHVVNITGEGNRKIRVQVFNTYTNKSINCDSKTIVIDRTAPKCPAIAVSGSKADNTWYKTDVTLTISPTGDTAKWSWYTNKKDGSWHLWSNNNTGKNKKTLGDDGARTRQGKIVVYDKAGNSRDCFTDKYKIDETLSYVTGKLVHPTKGKGSWSDGTKNSSDHLHYSKSYGGAWHGGNDISVSKGTTVVAMDGGEVIKADTTTNKCSSSRNCKSEGYVHFGKLVLLKHYISGKTYYTVYGHLNKVSVKVGNKVKQGEKIGESGNTGNSSGAHLHVGMSYNKYDNNGYPIYGKNVIAPYVYISGNKKGNTYVGNTGKNK